MKHTISRFLLTLSPAFFALSLIAVPENSAEAACTLPVNDFCTNDAYYTDNGMQHTAAHCVGANNRQQTCNTTGTSQFNVNTCANGGNVATVRTNIKALCAAIAQRHSCGIVNGNQPDTFVMFATLGADTGFIHPNNQDNCVTTRKARIIYSDRTQNQQRTIQVFDAFPQ